MPFKSKKQKRFFQAIAHGMKPRGGKGPSKAVARKFIKDSRREGYAQGGLTGFPPGGLGALAGRGVARPRAGGNLGRTGGIGPLGPAGPLSKGLAAKRTAARAPVGALGAIGVAGGGNNVPPTALRPRPGRTANGALALAGTKYHQALDRRR